MGQTMQVSIDLGQIVAFCVALIFAGVGYWRGSAPMRQALKRLSFVFEDWHGVPDRDGVKGRPGIMVRLQTIEERQEATAAELRTNGGSSLRDAVIRVEVQQGDIIRTVAALESAVRSQAVVVVPETVNGAGDASRAGGAAIVAHPYRASNGG